MLVLIVLPFIAIQQASFSGGIETISYPGCDYRMVIVTFPISTVSDLFMIMAAAEKCRGRNATVVAEVDSLNLAEGADDNYS